MAAVYMIAFVVIFQQCSAVLGEAAANQTQMLQIIEGSDICANTGDELTLNCAVFAPIPSNLARVKWSFGNSIQTVCNNLKDRIGNDSSTTCNLTITVGPAAEGVYTCKLTIPDADRLMNVKRTVDLKANNCVVGDAAANQTEILQIIEGSDVCANTGDELTLNCVVFAPIPSNRTGVKWLFKNNIQAVCNNLKDRIGNDSSTTCNLTITVGPAAEGVYTCKLMIPDADRLMNVKRTVLSINCDHQSTLQLLDPSTGTVVADSDYGPVCVRSGTTQQFECRIQGARPSQIWNFTWILGTQTIRAESEARTTADGLVNVSSWHVVRNHVNENLTCLATSSDRLLNATVLITVCEGGNGVIIAVATLVSVVTLVVLATPMFFKCRRKWKEQFSVKTSDVRSSVKMDVVSDLDDPIGQPGQSGIDFVEFEDRTTPQGPHNQEDTTADQNSQENEDRIRPQVTHNYEYKISQQVADQDTVASQVEYDETEQPLEEAPMPPDSEDDENSLPPWSKGWVVPRCDVIVDERVLGRGNFGEVRSGGVVKDGLLIRAAIKILKGRESTTEKDDFMDEFHTLTSIGHHRNVVSLLGACQHREVLYVALEYLSRGDLRRYLRKARSESDTDQDALSSQQLVKFALDVAKGMEHLAKARVIHRDLAARNILLSEELVAKVSDFGLSRREDIYVQTSERRVPVRWLAIESITYQKYTTKSDVWSFGILLWEIATLGGTPYPTTRSEALARKLKGGYRMAKPSNCDHKSYALMRKCWQEDPNNRPSFSDLVSIFKDMDDRIVEHTYFLPDRLHYEDLSEIRPEFDDN